jgi:Spy/CpxP family protein refolding chaperone
MIAREELQLLISGAVSQAGSAIEAAAGRTLTRSETAALGRVIATAMHMVAERAAVPLTPPPPPAARDRRHAVHFNPVKTQELQLTPEQLQKLRAIPEK